MRPAGIAAFEARTEDRSGVYSYEQREQARLDPDEAEAAFRDERSRVGVVRASSAPSYPQGARLLGRQREASGDAGEAPGCCSSRKLPRVAGGGADAGRRAALTPRAATRPALVVEGLAEAHGILRHADG